MVEAFIYKDPVVNKEKREDIESKDLLKKSQSLLENHETKKGGFVLLNPLNLLELGKGVSLPSSYMAIPLKGKDEDITLELGMLKDALNILENKDIDYNPFYFVIDYNVLEKTDENGKKRKVLLTSDSEKIEIAESMRNEAIAFVEKWSKAEKRQYLFQLAANKKENDILMGVLLKELNKGIDDDSSRNKMIEQLNVLYEIRNSIEKSYKYL